MNIKSPSGSARPAVGSKIEIKNTASNQWMVYTVISHDPSDPNKVECSEGGSADDDSGIFTLFGDNAAEWHPLRTLTTERELCLCTGGVWRIQSP